MSFFYADQRADKPKRSTTPAKARLEDIPVKLLQQESCKVCPRSAGDGMKHPRMAPEGPTSAPVYLLGTSPSASDDERNAHFTDDVHEEIYRKFGKSFMQEYVRSNYTVQCMGDEHVAVTECCRGRIITDIEATRPLVVVTIGDDPLHWATGFNKGTAPQWRGQLSVAKFGKHVCWLFPLIRPNYASRKQTTWSGKGTSSFEQVLQADVRWLKDNFDRLLTPKYYAAPYDKGVELLTGDQPGDIHRLEKRLRELGQHKRSAVDLETNGLRPYMLRHPHILTAAVGTYEDTLAFPLRISSAGHDEGWGTTGREQRAMELFAEYLQYSGRKAVHNLAFEMEWIEHEFGGEVLRRTDWDDTMALSYVLDGMPGIKALNVQTLIHFGFALKDQSPIDVRQEQWWLKHSLKTILKYNGMDTKWTDLLRRIREPDLDAEANARSIYEQRIRLAPALVLTEAPGLPVDMDYARKLDEDMRASMKATEVKLLQCKEVRDYERKHGHFEPTNSNHALVLMHDMLQRPETKREDRNGNVTLTTDEEALSAIPGREVPSAKLILEHREVSKLHSTYVLPALQKKWICRDGRIRSKYSSLHTLTSRLSSEDPNEQNWPKRKHKHVRGMIYIGHGRWLVAFDYGQIEFRVVGMASGDENLVKYCWTGYDVHKFWAQRMIKEYPAVQDWIIDEFAETLATIKAHDGKQYDEDKAILKTLRQEAKNKWVFPQLFGSTTDACARNLHLPSDVASDLGGEFWDEFRGVKKWQQELIKFYERNLYVETLTGFRRRGAMSVNELINMPIQGTAAAIVQEAHTVLSERAAEEEDAELQPILNVHDDLTFDIADGNLEPKMDTIAREMCKPRFDFINVPLLVEVSAGARWDACEEIKVYRSDVLFGLRNPYKEQA